VSIEIFAKNLENIAHEMGLVMMAFLGSPVIAEAVDFSTFIADAHGDIICYAGLHHDLPRHRPPGGQAHPGHGPREQIRPGRHVSSATNPFTTGNAHAVDVGVVRPIFASGPAGPDDDPEHDRLVLVGGARSTTSVASPGSMAPMATEAYGERCGCPGQAGRPGRLVDDIWRIIETKHTGCLSWCKIQRHPLVFIRPR